MAGFQPPTDAEILAADTTPGSEVAAMVRRTMDAAIEAACERADAWGVPYQVEVAIEPGADFTMRVVATVTARPLAAKDAP